MFPNNKYLLESYFDFNTTTRKMGYQYIVAKPIYGREGTGVKFGLEYSS
jgi:glutathionylspermidine synthase